jgi:transcriptional regulator with XRE-family HTH domain
MVTSKRRTPHAKALSLKLGRRMLTLCEDYGWSQRELGLRAGLDASYISRIGRGQIEPCLGTLETLAHTFGLTLSAFLEGVKR